MESVCVNLTSEIQAKAEVLEVQVHLRQTLPFHFFHTYSNIPVYVISRCSNQHKYINYISLSDCEKNDFMAFFILWSVMTGKVVVASDYLGYV